MDEPKRCPHCGITENFIITVDEVFLMRQPNGSIRRRAIERRDMKAYPDCFGRCHYCGE